MNELWDSTVAVVVVSAAAAAAVAALVFVIKPLFKRKPQRLSVPFRPAAPQESWPREASVSREQPPVREAPSQLSLQIQDFRGDILRTLEMLRFEIANERAASEDRLSSYERSTRATLVELGGKLDLLAATVAQYSKDVGKVEGRLADVVQVLGVQISEVRALAGKIQKITDESSSPKRGLPRS